jgi:hypothetical protein
MPPDPGATFTDGITGRNRLDIGPVGIAAKHAAQPLVFENARPDLR